jgi:hypothetical protein
MAVPTSLGVSQTELNKPEKPVDILNLILLENYESIGASNSLPNVLARACHALFSQKTSVFRRFNG